MEMVKSIAKVHAVFLKICKDLLEEKIDNALMHKTIIIKLFSNKMALLNHTIVR